MTSSALLFAVICAAAVADFEPTVYTIDLDAPAESRWKAAVADIIKKHGYDDSWGKVFSYLDG
jgi:hypothetical protein